MPDKILYYSYPCVLLKLREILTSFGCSIICVKKIHLDSSFREMNTALGKMFFIGDGRGKKKIDPTSIDKVNNPISNRHIIHFL